MKNIVRSLITIVSETWTFVWDEKPDEMRDVGNELTLVMHWLTPVQMAANKMAQDETRIGSESETD